MLYKRIIMIGALCVIHLLADTTSLFAMPTTRKLTRQERDEKMTYNEARKLVFQQFDAMRSGEVEDDVYLILSDIFNEWPALLEERDFMGWTLLHEAAHTNHLEMAELLIRKGADCYARTDVVGDTPLHLAARVHAWDIISLLYFEYEINEDLNEIAAYPFDHDCALCPLKQIDLRNEILSRTR